MSSPITLEERLDYILARIQKATIKAGRKPKEITLVGVTKSFPVKIWEQALNANLSTLGENRIQEAYNKTEIFTRRNKIELHLIGHLQSNKTKKAIEIFDVIQTVDSIKLAEKIDYICKEKNKKQSIYLQVNTGADPMKYGISVINANYAAEKITKMDNLILEGIMNIPPKNISIKKLHFIYRKTRKIRDEIRIKINKHCKNISMGMSNDYETAITEGATHIRIGVGLFGERPQ